MNGFARRREQSKDEIRKAAWGLFGQFGVDKVSIAAIARKAGVSPATIYNNFGSKEALAREFVTNAVEQLVNRARDVLALKKQYRQKMAAFVDFISEIVADREPAAARSAVFAASIDLQDDADIRKIRSEAQERMTMLLLAIIQEGKQQGQVNTDLSREALEIYFGLFMNLFTDPQLQHRFSRHPALVRQLGTLMIHGLGVQRH